MFWNAGYSPWRLCPRLLGIKTIAIFFIKCWIRIRIRIKANADPQHTDIFLLTQKFPPPPPFRLRKKCSSYMKQTSLFLRIWNGERLLNRPARGSEQQRANLFSHYQYTVILYSAVHYRSDKITDICHTIFSTPVTRYRRSLKRENKINNINLRTWQNIIFLLIEGKICWTLTTVT
jgi:hypothetical protein